MHLDWCTSIVGNINLCSDKQRTVLTMHLDWCASVVGNIKLFSDKQRTVLTML